MYHHPKPPHAPNSSHATQRFFTLSFHRCFGSSRRIATPLKRRMFPTLLPASNGLSVFALACCRTVSLQTDSTGGKSSQCSFLCSSNYSILLYLVSPFLSPSLSVIMACSQCLSHHTTAFQMKTLTERVGSSWLKSSDDSVREKQRWREMSGKH